MSGYSSSLGAHAKGNAIGENARAFTYVDRSGRRNEIGFSTLLHLLDRRPQFVTLNSQYKSAFKATPKRPLLVFVFGSKVQYHLAVLNRFRWFTVPMVQNDRPGESFDLPKRQADTDPQRLEWPRGKTIEACVDDLWQQITDKLRIDPERGKRRLCTSLSSEVCAICQMQSPDYTSCEGSLRRFRAQVFGHELNIGHRGITFYVHAPRTHLDSTQAQTLKWMVEFWNMVGEVGLVVPFTMFVLCEWQDSFRDVVYRSLPHLRNVTDVDTRQHKHRVIVHFENILPAERDFVEIAILDVLGDICSDDIIRWFELLRTAERRIAERLNEISSDLERVFGRWRVRSMKDVFDRFSSIARKSPG
jgi:hypothetical protein